jgi:hypothetical protein
MDRLRYVLLQLLRRSRYSDHVGFNSYV